MSRSDTAGDGRGAAYYGNQIQPPAHVPAPQPAPTPAPVPVPTPAPTVPTIPVSTQTQIVPGQATAGTGQINVADFASNIVTNPSSGMAKDNPNTTQNESQFLSDHVQGIDENAPGTNIDPNNPNLKLGDTPTAGTTAATTNEATATTATEVDPRQAQTFEAQKTQDNITENGQATAQQGTVDPNHLIDAPQLDMQGAATGVNQDGTVNETGKALQEYAKQNITNIIDTSTPSGKALAEALGDGNYTDSKATLKGQLDILQSEFVDANGNPKIPAWAASTARNVAKIAAFSGMTGTAATAAMSQALLEASIPIAQQDSQFFQTVTLQNLSNKQEATINRANVLAKFDLTNIDNRMAAAVENSKAFLQMDMANLDNRQQAEIINTQARVQSILEDANAVNAQRLFTAQSQNEMDKFYDNLNASIKQFNSAQQNAMAQFNSSEANNTSRFNASESNSTSKFNADMENNRQQFYANMQFNIDVANAKWRQAVTLQENAQQFEAAATDVKNMTTMSQEQLNQIWDRADSLLDYAWKSSENEADRKSALLIAKTQAETQARFADQQGTGAIFGSIAGAASSKLLDWAFNS